MSSCEYKCFVFPEHFLYFYPGSPVIRMTQTITQNPSVTLLKFSPANNWRREILTLLQHLVDLETDKSDFYCCEVLSTIFDALVHFSKTYHHPGAHFGKSRVNPHAKNAGVY